jgi:DNA-binding LacI/PurR family transcriptional regulator
MARQSSNHVRIVDVARASGVSPSTVSIVLNAAPLSKHLAAKTKAHILKTAQSMGYRPDASARSLRSRRSGTVGVMVFDISDPICPPILRGVELALDPTPFLPIVMDAHNKREQFERYLELMLERRVEGLIVIANWLFAGIELLPEFGKTRIPTVVVGRDLSSSSTPSIIVDNEAGGYMALEHLYALGHRRIAFLRGPGELLDSVQRWDGIRRFARQVKLTIDRRLVKKIPTSSDPNSTFEAGRSLTEKLLQEGANFTAIVAFDDVTALGAMRALYKAGRTVPQECSVIGFDDVPQSAFASPGLTTIRQPMEKMGEDAAQWMVESLRDAASAGPELTLRRLMKPELVRRDSTAAPSGS